MNRKDDLGTRTDSRGNPMEGFPKKRFLKKKNQAWPVRKEVGRNGKLKAGAQPKGKDGAKSERRTAVST